MSSNIHALERVKTLSKELDPPNRADVEAAFRTIIRWTGDDPEREGLIETPNSRSARIRGALRRVHSGSSRNSKKDF
jgi:GTP cyclohydrolase I